MKCFMLQRWNLVSRSSDCESRAFLFKRYTEEPVTSGVGFVLKEPYSFLTQKPVVKKIEILL